MKDINIVTPAEDQQDGQGSGKHDVQGQAKRTGPVRLGEEKAKGTPYCYVKLFHQKKKR